MPLPQKAVEQLAREPVRTPGWSGRLLMFSGTVFFVSVVVYAGLRFGYEPRLRSQIRALDADISAFDQKIPPGEQEKIVNLHSQFTNLKETLDTKAASVRAVLGWLERKTSANVAYTKFDFNAQSRTVNLTGQAKSGDDVASQLALFEGDRETVERAAFTNANTGQKGIWQFNVTLTLKESFFHPRP